MDNTMSSQVPNGAAPPPQPETAQPQPPQAPAKKSKLKLFALIGVIAVAVVGLGLYLSQGSGGEFKGAFFTDEDGYQFGVADDETATQEVVDEVKATLVSLDKISDVLNWIDSGGTKLELAKDISESELEPVDATIWYIVTKYKNDQTEITKALIGLEVAANTLSKADVYDMTAEQFATLDQNVKDGIAGAIKVFKDEGIFVVAEEPVTSGFTCPVCAWGEPNTTDYLGGWAKKCCSSVPGCKWEPDDVGKGQCVSAKTKNVEGPATNCADYSGLEDDNVIANRARQFACVEPCQFTDKSGSYFQGDTCIFVEPDEPQAETCTGKDEDKDSLVDCADEDCKGETIDGKTCTWTIQEMPGDTVDLTHIALCDLPEQCVAKDGTCYSIDYKTGDKINGTDYHYICDTGNQWSICEIGTEVSANTKYKCDGSEWVENDPGTLTPKFDEEKVVFVEAMIEWLETLGALGKNSKGELFTVASLEEKFGKLEIGQTVLDNIGNYAVVLSDTSLEGKKLLEEVKTLEEFALYMGLLKEKDSISYGIAQDVINQLKTLEVMVVPMEHALTVTLAEKQPEIQGAEPGAENVAFTKLVFRSSPDSVKIIGLEITREDAEGAKNAKGSNSDISKVEIFDEGEKSIAETVMKDDKALISFTTPVEVSPDKVKTLTIKADISADAVAGNTNVLGIESAEDVSVEEGAKVAMKAPLYGTAITILDAAAAKCTKDIKTIKEDIKKLSKKLQGELDEELTLKDMQDFVTELELIDLSACTYTYDHALCTDITKALVEYATSKDYDAKIEKAVIEGVVESDVLKVCEALTGKDACKAKGPYNYYELPDLEAEDTILHLECVCPKETDMKQDIAKGTFTCEEKVVVKDCAYFEGLLAPMAAEMDGLISGTVTPPTGMTKEAAFAAVKAQLKKVIEGEYAAYLVKSTACTFKKPYESYVSKIMPLSVLECAEYKKLMDEKIVELDAVIEKPDLFSNPEGMLEIRRAGYITLLDTAVNGGCAFLSEFNYESYKTKTFGGGVVTPFCTKYDTELAELKKKVEGATTQEIADLYLKQFKAKIDEATKAGCSSIITTEYVIFKNWVSPCAKNLADIKQVAALMTSVPDEVIFTAYKLTLMDEVSDAEAMGCMIPIEIKLLLTQPFVPSTAVVPGSGLSSLLVNLPGTAQAAESYGAYYGSAPPAAAPAPQVQTVYVPTGGAAVQPIQAMGIGQPIPAAMPGQYYAAIPANTGPEVYVYGLLALAVLAGYEVYRRKSDRTGREIK